MVPLFNALARGACLLMFLAVLVLHPASPAAAGVEGVARFHWLVTTGQSAGSGFPVAPGLVATNAHVVRDLRPGDRLRLVAPDRRRARGRLLAVSPRMDLALIAVPIGDAAVTAARGARLQPGSPVVAVGAQIRSGVAHVRQSSGQVLATEVTRPAYGTGALAAFNGIGPGFSGGPVFDAEGRLVGMLSAISLHPASTAQGQKAFMLSAKTLQAETRRLVAEQEQKPRAGARSTTARSKRQR